MESLELSNLRVMDARDYLDLMEKMNKFGRFEAFHYESFYSLFFLFSLYETQGCVCLKQTSSTEPHLKLAPGLTVRMLPGGV